MFKKVVSILFQILLFLSMIAFTFYVSPINAETIWRNMSLTLEIHRCMM